MFNKLFRYDKYIIFITLLCLFHLAGNIYWLSLNKAPFQWDQAGHTIISFKFYDFFIGLNLNQDFLSISDYYPPFVHLIVAFLMLIFGKNILIGPLVVSGFFILAIIFLYLYTLELFKDRLASFFAASLFSFLPNVYALSREFLLEIPLVSMTLGSLYFLEKSNNFSNRKNTLFFAIFFALAFSIKWTAVIFLFIPLLINLKKMLPRIHYRNLLFSLGIILLINLPWYIHNLPIILYAAKITATPESSDPQSVLSYESIKYYLFMMTNFQLTWFGMITFLLSIIYFIYKKGKQSIFLIATFLFVYLAFTFIGNKDLRYIIFLAPICAIIISYFLSTLRKNLSYSLPKYELKREAIALLTGFVFFYYIFYYFTLSFGIPINSFQTHIRSSVNVPYFGWIDTINLGRDSSHFLAPTYDPTIWPNTTIAKELNNHNPQKDIKILMISEKAHLNQVNMELIRRQLGYDKMHFSAPYDMALFPNEEELERYLLRFDILLVAENDIGPKGAVRSFETLKQMAQFLESDKSEKIIKINSYPLPDSDKLNVYVPKVLTI